ncbi:MAG: hypothetical protein RLZZ399_565 [Verrucomicrobiota bacterium]|jgi:lipopolysaccharide transport system permease protein
METINLDTPPADGLLSKQARQPVLKIRPALPWGEWVEIWAYRELLWTLALRDLRLRYRQTALGVLWVVFQPVAGAGIFAVVFGWVAGFSGGEPRYFLYSLAGLLGWNAFQSTLSKASMSIIGNGPLVSKVYFPRLLLPFATVFSTLVDFILGVLVFLGTALLSDWRPSFALAMVPLWLACGLLMALGTGLLAASVMTRFRDVQHVLPMLLPFMMYATPVAYALKEVPAAWRWWFEINPMSWVIEGMRAGFLGREGVPAAWGAYSVGMSVFVFGLGLFSFRRMERSLNDVL